MTAPHEFALDEQETTFTIDATDRNLVRVYSNDSVFIARLEKVGAKVHRACADGGMFYDLHADQWLLRKGRRQMSPEQRAETTARLAAMRKGSASPAP